MRIRLIVRRSGWLAALCVTSLLISSCGDGARDGDGERVSLSFVKCGTMNPGTTADASVPVVMGYWEAENIDVDQPLVNGSSECVQGMDAGTFEVANIGATSVLIALARGVPLKAIAAYVNANIWFPYLLEESPIRTVQDFKGTTVGVPTLESGAVPMFGALLETGGLSLDDVDLVAVGTGAEVVAFLESGRIDAYAASSSHAALIRPVLNLRSVSNQEYDAIGFHIPVMVREDVLGEKRDALIGLLRGIFKSMVFAQANPEAAVAMHYKVWPDTMPTGKTDEQIISEGVNAVSLRLAEFEAFEGIWGNSDPKVHIRSHVELLVRQGSVDLDESRIDEFIDGMWYPDLLAEANDFDTEAVQAQARATNWRDHMP